MNQKNQQIPTHRILTRKIRTEMSSIHLVEVPIHKTAPSTTIQSRQIRARAQNHKTTLSTTILSEQIGVRAQNTRPPARIPPSPVHKHRQDPAANQIRDLTHSQRPHTPAYSGKARRKSKGQSPSSVKDRQATHLQHNKLPVPVVTRRLSTQSRKRNYGQHSNE